MDFTLCRKEAMLHGEMRIESHPPLGTSIWSGSLRGGRTCSKKTILIVDDHPFSGRRQVARGKLSHYEVVGKQRLVRKLLQKP